jgi:hypothetical protein
MKCITGTRLSTLVILALAMAAGGCQQKSSDATPEATAPAPASAAPSAQPDVEPTAVQLERAQRQAQLDYATMEDSFLNDPKAQWAQQATATSTFGDSRNSAAESNKPKNLVGKPDGEHWTNDNQDMGFDSIELTYEKPVHATEVRAVFVDGISTVSKVELKTTDGGYVTVWSGLNEDEVEKRGPRHWFIRKFDRTEKLVDGVKITVANPVSRGYKVVDAVQLVGE